MILYCRVKTNVVVRRSEDVVMFVPDIGIYMEIGLIFD